MKTDRRRAWCGTIRLHEPTEQALKLGDRRNRCAPYPGIGPLVALKATFQRDAQSNSFLARCSLSSLKFLRNFTSTCFPPSERLQRSHICSRPGSPFLRFHNLSPSLKGRRLGKRQRSVNRARHVSAAYAKRAVRRLDLVGPFALRARSKSEGAACRFDSNAAGKFI
jgi:hypothetical protein